MQFDWWFANWGEVNGVLASQSAQNSRNAWATKLFQLAHTASFRASRSVCITGEADSKRIAKSRGPLWWSVSMSTTSLSMAPRRIWRRRYDLLKMKAEACSAARTSKLMGDSLRPPAHYFTMNKVNIIAKGYRGALARPRAFSMPSLQSRIARSCVYYGGPHMDGLRPILRPSNGLSWRAASKLPGIPLKSRHGRRDKKSTSSMMGHWLATRLIKRRRTISVYPCPATGRSA